jgi:hypothetical protein
MAERRAQRHIVGQAFLPARFRATRALGASVGPDLRDGQPGVWILGLKDLSCVALAKLDPAPPDRKQPGV